MRNALTLPYLPSFLRNTFFARSLLFFFFRFTFLFSPPPRPSFSFHCASVIYSQHEINYRYLDYSPVGCFREFSRLRFYHAVSRRAIATTPSTSSFWLSRMGRGQQDRGTGVYSFVVSFQCKAEHHCLFGAPLGTMRVSVSRSTLLFYVSLYRLADELKESPRQSCESYVPGPRIYVLVCT